MRRLSSALSLVAAAFCAVAQPGRAAEPTPLRDLPMALSRYIDRDLLSWVNSDPILAAIQAQNRRHAGLTAPEITAREKDWAAQRDRSTRPLVDAVLNAPVSEFLRYQVARSGGRITEVFVMDAHGLTVAANAPPSDYWQGDEAKFQMSYAAGPGAIFVEHLRFDDSTRRYLGQVSFAVTDPRSGAVIGAITVGLEAAAFF